MRRFAKLCGFLALISTVHAEENSIFADQQKSCVAWKARKRVMLVSIVKPVGVSCEVDFKVSPKDTEGRQFFELSVPISSFNSGEKGRDEAVLKLLKADDQVNLSLRTIPMRDSEIAKIWSTAEGELPVILRLGGQDFDLELPYHIVQRENDLWAVGKVGSSFSALGIKAPRVAGGLIAKVFDELELHYQLRKSDLH